MSNNQEGKKEMKKSKISDKVVYIVLICFVCAIVLGVVFVPKIVMNKLDSLTGGGITDENPIRGTVKSMVAVAERIGPASADQAVTDTVIEMEDSWKELKTKEPELLAVLPDELKDMTYNSISEKAEYFRNLRNEYEKLSSPEAGEIFAALDELSILYNTEEAFEYVRENHLNVRLPDETE